jgi:hypothetical protein
MSHAVISQVGFALLPAFVTFRTEMYPRLLLFFEGILRGMLHEEKRLRDLAKGGAGGSSSQGTTRPFIFFGFVLIPLLYIEHFAMGQPDGSPPTVSIQVEPYEYTPAGVGDDPQSWTSR